MVRTRQQCAEQLKSAFSAARAVVHRAQDLVTEYQRLGPTIELSQVPAQCLRLGPAAANLLFTGELIALEDLDERVSVEREKLRTALQAFGALQEELALPAKPKPSRQVLVNIIS